MDSALIVSNSDKGNDFFTGMLRQISCSKVSTAKTGGETRRFMMNQNFDLYIINNPLLDESGEQLSVHIATRTSSQIILLVKADVYDVVSSKVEDYGVITIAKPINRHIFWSCLKLAKASFNRMQMLKTENTKLYKKIEDIKTIDRAKCILISYLNMSEAEAHKYIEKQAMDLRASKIKIAEKILKTYEN